MRVRLQTAAILIAALLSTVGPGQAADPRRTLLQHCQPVYPEIARQMHVGGAILLRVSILPDGHVSQVELESGHPLLVEAAEQAVRRWKYSPAAAATVTTVQIDFNASR